MNKYVEVEYQIRKVLWLVRNGDWKSLITIIKYCSSNYGGIYFPIIILDDNEDLSEDDIKYISDYDPDYIILPKEYKKEISYTFRVFSYIPWEKKHSILNRDLNGKFSTCNYSPSYSNEEYKKVNMLSTYNEDYISESLFSQIYLGDVNHMEPMFESWDGEISLYSWGPEVSIVESMLKDEIEHIEARAYYDGENVTPAPNRSKLDKIIKSENKFPFGDFRKQLELLSDAQNFVSKGYLQNTIPKREIFNEHNLIFEKEIPSATIFISKNFDFITAINLWNSRVNRHNSFWFNNDFFIKNIDTFIDWLDSDGGGQYVAFGNNRAGIITLLSDELELESIIKRISLKRKTDWPIVGVDEFAMKYPGSRILETQKLMLIEHESEIELFIEPNFFKDSTGFYTVRIIDNKYRLPYHFSDLELLTPSYFTTWDILTKSQRIDASGYIVTQVSIPQTIKINYPNKDLILDSILAKYHLKKEYTTTAKYQNEVSSLFSGILGFSYIFYNKNNIDFFNLLLNLSENQKLAGWLIKNPFKMRIFTYEELSNLLDRYSSESKKHDLINKFIEKEIIEYGIFCKCKSCDYSGFYLLDNVGKFYECTRCRQKNYILNHTDIRYRISPIVQVGIADNNIDVPLAALTALTNKHSKRQFIWYYDLNIIYGNKSGNVDITCFIDGLLFFGEAKSNDEIENKQFSFYKTLLSYNFVSGLIFATKCKKWKEGTLNRIESLRNTGKEIIILTIDDLLL